jgi:two-component system, cell cycle sensor histidine kinase and response regulator CckA
MNPSTEFKNNRILVIDDNPAIHEDIRKILRGHSESDDSMASSKALLFDEEPVASDRAQFDIDSAFQGEEGLRKVQDAVEAGHPYAMAFVDVRMPPGWDGVETVTRIWKDYPDLQVVICTAYSDYSWEQMIRQIGKSDNMVILKKPFDNIEVMQLAHALTEKWLLTRQVKSQLDNLDQLVSQRTTELQSANEKLKQEITERLQMEKALRLSEERFSKAFKASPIPLAIQSLRQEKFVDANQGFQDLTGFSRHEIIGRTPAELGLWADPNGGNAVLRKLREEMSVRNLPSRLKSKADVLHDVLLSVELFELDGEPFLLTIAQDITEQMKLETQLRQSQKMEAIGQLAAGVAHDFNNILTVVQGNASLLLAAKPPESGERKPLQTICAAADRASKLVRQLLTFSRKQFVQMRPLSIQEALAAAADMLPRLLREDIALKVDAAPALPLINADAGMIEQMLINLAVNARDAMPDGGILTFQAELATLGPEGLHHNPERHAGEFIRLSVRDTGCGIPAEIMPRIFEPFFTTKAVGKGTGLGLATVYGIAKQHQGWIEVESQPGKGSTFNVFIPVFKTEVPVPVKPLTEEPLKGGHETILVAEDEEDVRDFVGELLKSYGYTVLAAGSGAEALEVWSQHRQDVDLLLTDMVMPGGFTGRQLAERLRTDSPALRIIYTSGYSPGMAGRDLAVLKEDNFLAKPYRPATLLQMVRDCLDQRPRPT